MIFKNEMLIRSTKDPNKYTKEELEGKTTIEEQLNFLLEEYKTAPIENVQVLDTIMNLLDAHYEDKINLDKVKEIVTKAFELKNKMDTDTGNVSDGYHTFDELYHHRAILFATLCNTYRNEAWKSKQHHDPEQPMYEGMFIVGINTPAGQTTYHYDIEPYWNMFNVQEMERAPEYDGHTPTDAINRIALYAGIDLFSGDTPV